MQIQFRLLARPHSELIYETEIVAGMPTPNDGEILRFGFDRYRVKFREFRFDGNNPTLTIFMALEPQEEPKQERKVYPLL